MPKRQCLRMSTPDEVRQSLTRVCNLLLNEELPSSNGNGIISAGNAILRSIRTDELQRKLDELEAIIKSEDR